MTTKELRKRMLGASSALRVLALIGAGAAATGFAIAPAMAQDITSGRLSGQVTDESGNPVPGATIVVESADRGFTRTTTSSGQGSFSVPQLSVGNYTVTVSAPDFDTVRAENVAVSLGGSAYNFALTSATSADNVIVVTGATLRTIDFSGTATGVVINAQEVASRLPVGRDISSIQLLAPQTTAGDTAFGGVSLGGSSVAENIFYINGMNVTNFRTFVGGTTVPFEFYDQIQVKTGGYQAEFGRNTGGAVIALTRSGSNEFHGGANFTWSPDSLRSDTPNTYAADNSLDELESIEGNIWASGPLIKDRLFFFAFFNPRSRISSDTARTDIPNLDGSPTGEYVNTTTTTRKRDTPFYGGKIDLNLFDGHRVEATYFNDSSMDVVNQSGSVVNQYAGGENMIFKYTGSFTDWFTLSALYGKSKFNQTSSGPDDAIPYTLDRRSGSSVFIAGSPAAVVETGLDERENYRIDGDFSVSLLGEHQIRVGWDYEKLFALNQAAYSGGVGYRYERSGEDGALDGLIDPFTDYVRVQTYQTGGGFRSKNMAFYAQDNWDVTDQLNLSLGIRNDRFTNYTSTGEKFVDIKNQWQPRIGVNFDPTGEGKTRFSAFFGRYYLPVAANTNIRLGGAELFLRDFYTLPVNGSGEYTGDLIDPTLGTKVQALVLSNGVVTPPSTLVSKNLKPQYLDEFILGGEHRFDSGIRVGLNLVYRKLGTVLEDIDIDGDGGAYDSLIESFCADQSLAYCNSETVPTVNGGGYILGNPGRDLIIDVLDDDGALHEVTLPASFLGIPKAKRNYYAAEFTFERPFDGVWGLNASYVWSRSRGNYEGGVKSDNGQDDTGITSDFDEPGVTDGASGYLPNHREHTFKVYGNYAPLEGLNLGFNALVQSPRKFGCIGAYPVGDGRGADSSSISFYCDAQIKAGNIDGTLGQPVGRGTVFESDWKTQIDLSAAYTFSVGALANLTLRADVFNVLNSAGKLDYLEIGDKDDVDSIEYNYGMVSGYQAPRSVRFSASFAF